jgi:hypothetical protein
MNMKLSKSLLTTVFIVLFIVAAIVMWQMYNSAGGQHELAQSDLSKARLSQTSLNKLKTDLDTQLAQAAEDVAAWDDKLALLQTELAQANVSLSLAQKNFPASVQTIEYTETIMGLAKSAKLDVSLLASAAPQKGDLSTPEFTFYSNIFTIKISGPMSNILDFIDRISADKTFKTGAISPISFTIPPPLSQSDKDQMRADIKARMVAEKTASLPAESRVGLVEEALLNLLGDSSDGSTVAQMTQRIHDIIAAGISPQAADLLSNAIAVAIDNDLADKLVDIVAGVYADAIAKLFSEDDVANLLPLIAGPLGDDITTAIQVIPVDAIPRTVKSIITNALNKMVSDKITSMVADSDVEAALSAAVVTASGVPSAQFSIGVYSYNGS